MPEKLPVVELTEGLESLVLPTSSHLEHLHHLQLVLCVGGTMRVLDILYKTLVFLIILGEHLGEGERRRERVMKQEKERERGRRGGRRYKEREGLEWGGGGGRGLEGQGRRHKKVIGESERRGGRRGGER